MVKNNTPPPSSPRHHGGPAMTWGDTYNRHKAKGMDANDAAFRADQSEARKQVPFPQPRRKDGGEPCGECRIHTGETCDICGAVNPPPAPREEGETP